MPHALELPRRSDAASIARGHLSRWFAKDLEADELYRAKLLASELVNNAVIHGTGRIQLNAELDVDRLVIEVIDEGEGFEHEARRHSFDDLHGRGLLIVDAESSRWGIREGTTHVWFELERRGPRLGERDHAELG